MPERPIIVLPTPAEASRDLLSSGSSKIKLPNLETQTQRLEPKFESLRAHFERKSIELRSSAAGQSPEDVIVFETVGSVANFINALRRVPGLDFLNEWEIEDIAPDDNFFRSDRPNKLLNGRLYLVMSNQQALQQLLQLWKNFQRGIRPERGFSPFKEAFKHLLDVRRWSQEDRLLETGVVEYWEDVSESGDNEIVPFEIELWFRQTPELRAASASQIKQIIASHHGEVMSVCEIEAICYHSVSVALPVSQIRRLVNREDAELLGESSIMYFRPSGQSVAPISGELDLQSPIFDQHSSQPTGNPIVALLDGLPLENHSRLRGRLRIDDPDSFGVSYVAHERQHGTTMASIILHGDLSSPQTPLAHPLYVRPILRPDPKAWNASRDERIPHGVNPLDLTIRAVRRLFEIDAATAPAAPSVKIINFSIGDPTQQFHSVVSPWGKLIDWLAVKYNILICVSAGNHSGPIELDVERSSFANLSPHKREEELLKSLYRDLRLRRILSPADSINAITVGAWQHDFGQVSAQIRPYRFNPHITEPLPSPITGLGCGFRNSTKPDILFPGGRQFYTERLGNTHANAILEVDRATIAPGILAASPPNSGPPQLDKEKHSRGTSNATALATRCAAFLHDQLRDLRSEPGGEALTDEYIAVLLKAMLVHTAAWGATYDHLRTLLKPEEMSEEKFRRIAARFLGFGFVMPIQSLIGSDHRATMLGCGSLLDGSAHEYRIPLPPSLSGVRGLRRVVVTLAWLAPIHPRHRNYRGAALWFEVEKEKLATTREDTQWQSVRNGTVQHEVFEGQQATAFAEEETMLLKVNCRADADKLSTSIRYGLVVSIEAADELGIPIYEEIAARIRPSVMVPVSGG